MTKRSVCSRLAAVWAVAIGVCLATDANAAELNITGKKLLLKEQKLVLLSKDPSVTTAGISPTAGVSSINFFDGTNDVTFDLPGPFWTSNGSGTLFKYKNGLAPIGPSPVKVAKLKNGLLKVVAKLPPFPVPAGPATINILVSFNGATSALCMTFTGTGDGVTFLAKNAALGNCERCGNGTSGGVEECDGADAAACPGLCLSDCTCDQTADACCEYSTSCGGSPAGFCMSLGGTPVGGDAVCDATNSCVPASSSTPGGCCELGVPLQQCVITDTTTCAGAGGTYHAGANCLPSGLCGSCQATTGGFCWYLSAGGQNCAAACAAVGKTFDPATTTFAGSDGTDANCTAVLDDLGVTAGPLTTTSCVVPVGCVFNGGGGGLGRVRCSSPTTDAASSFTNTPRACACL